MDDHHRAGIEGWWASGCYDPSEPILAHVRADGSNVIGGKRAIAQVRAVLERNLKHARKELELSYEVARGREWWDLYIEGPADDELLVTLKLAVKRRTGEEFSDYIVRLRKVEAAMRARLPDYIRAPADETEER